MRSELLLEVERSVLFPHIKKSNPLTKLSKKINFVERTGSTICWDPRLQVAALCTLYSASDIIQYSRRLLYWIITENNDIIVSTHPLL